MSPYVATIANGATATGAAQNLAYKEGLQILIQVTIVSGSPTIAIQGSITGATGDFVALPSLNAITANGIFTFVGPLPWIRPVVASGTGQATVRIVWGRG